MNNGFGEWRQARLGAATLHYQVLGAGRPLVLLHGLSGSSRWWAKNAQALAASQRVYLIDMLGFGRSRGQVIRLASAADQIVEWMDDLDLAQASLVGHSMGGTIAADLAARFPTRVDRLVLVAAPAGPLERSYLQHAASLWRQFWRLPPNFVPALFFDLIRAGPRSVCSALWQLFHTDSSPRLASIQAPVLILWGQNDQILPVETGERLHRRLPQAEFQVISGAGHVPMWDQPQAFNRLVLSFLACQPAASSTRPEGLSVI